MQTGNEGASERERLAGVVEGFFGTIGALGLGASFEVMSRGMEGRAPLRVVLTPPEGPGAGPRRWAPVATALQVLLEAVLARDGIVDAPVEVTLREVSREGRPPPVREDIGLVTVARALAETSARLGRAFALGPMSVGDRRQVHQALGEVPQVWTQSEGEGIFRRLWIVPRSPRREATAAAAGGAESPSRNPGDDSVA